MRKSQLFEHVLNYFEAHNPSAKTELVYGDPYQLLVAVTLSAQCTDKRVNKITPQLFSNFPDVESMASASVDEVREIIKSISYPNSKAKYLVNGAKIIRDRFNGILPSTVEELIKIPGVGRKTAHVIASVVFNQPKLAVDTHVHRVAARIGLTKNAKTPLQTENQLLKYIPENKISLAHHWLILHGRYVCIARKPLCNLCGIRIWCKYYREK